MTRHDVRGAVLCGSLLASVLFAVPLSAAFLQPDIAWAFRLVVVAVLIVSALHPLSGALALALATPFAAAMASSLGNVPAGAAIVDATLLAFVSGASLRLLWPQEEKSRLAGPALLLLAAIVTSTIVELRALQAITPRHPLLPELWRHLTNDYWLATRDFVVVHHAVRWMAWLTAAVYIERAMRRRSWAGSPAVRLWIVAGTAGAAFAAIQLIEIIGRGQVPAWETFVAVMRTVRFSALHPDVNAAGSYFALFIVPAVIVGLRKRYVWMLLVSVPLLLLAFVIARSRAAVVAVVLVCCWAGAQNLIGCSSTHARRILLRSGGIAAVALIGAVALVAMFQATTRSHTSPNVALRVRVEIAEVGIRTAQRYPVFGVGLGDYIRMTRRAITPDTPILFRYAPEGENAHNNFLQIAVELGIPACLIFLWLVLPIAAAGLGSVTVPPTPELQGMGLGLLAFLITAILGHPLLIAEVGAAFFVALGLSAGLTPSTNGHGPLWRRAIVAGGVAFYFLSLVWRMT